MKLLSINRIVLPTIVFILSLFLFFPVKKKVQNPETPAITEAEATEYSA